VWLSDKLFKARFPSFPKVLVSLVCLMYLNVCVCVCVSMGEDILN